LFPPEGFRTVFSPYDLAAAGFASVEATRYLPQAKQLSAAKMNSLLSIGPPLFNQNTRCISKNSNHMLANALRALQILLVQAKARSTERAGRDECHRTRQAGRAEKGDTESIAELTWLK